MLYQACRAEIVCAFAKYQAVYDSGTQMPPTKIRGTAHCRTEPYICSAKDGSISINIQIVHVN